MKSKKQSNTILLKGDNLNLREEKHFVFWSNCVQRPLNLMESMFLRSVSPRIPNFLDESCLRNLTKPEIHFNNFIIYLWKNMLPHLHFLNFVGSQCVLTHPSLIFCMRNHYELINEKSEKIYECGENFFLGKEIVLEDEILEENNISNIENQRQLFNVTIDSKSAIADITKKKMMNLTPIYSGKCQDFCGVEEFEYNKYPDNLKILLYNLINELNSQIFKKLYHQAIKFQIRLVKNRDDISTQIYNNILFHSAQLCVDTKRGEATSIIMSEDLFNLFKVENSNTPINFDLKKADRTFRIINIGRVFDKFDGFIDTSLSGNVCMLSYSGEMQMDSGAYYTPKRGDLDFNVIYVNGKDKEGQLEFSIPTSLTFNFESEKYFRFIKFIDDDVNG